MFKKRGFTQIDWAISLAIFLMYLAWFFVIVKPQVIDTNILAPNYVALKDEFLIKVRGEVSKIPLIIETDNNLENNVFEIELDFLKNNDYGFNSSNPHFIEDDKIFILDSINNSKKIYFMVISENQTYPNNNYQDQGIIIENDSISLNSNMTIDYDANINSIYLNDVIHINNINYYQNEQRLTSNFSIDNKKLIVNLYDEFQPYYVKYSISSGSNKLIGRYKKLDNYNDFNTTIKYDLKNFEEYFIDNFHHGSLSEGDCDNNTGKMIKFYDDNTTLSFLFNKNININVCYDNDDYEVEFFFNDNSLNFEINFDDKEKLESDSDYEYYFGVDKTNNLPILNNIKNFNISRIEYDDFNFQIIVFNTTFDDTEIKKNSIVKIIGESPEATNRQVFSKDEIINVQDEYGTIWRMILNVKIWE